MGSDPTPAVVNLPELPSDVLGAISDPAGGRIVIVMGAGCCVESPTNLPVASRLARECHDELVANRVINTGDCANPDDLSELADVVFAKTGSQAKLVELFSVSRFRSAAPNAGHMNLGALMIEGAVSAALTLNYDYAPITALGSLSADGMVKIIESPSEFEQAGAVNLIYMHRSISQPADQLILRTEQLEASWEQPVWEELVAARFIGGTMAIFVGVGAAAAVFQKTSERLAAISGAKSRLYVAGPGAREDSAFFASMELTDDKYLKMTWSGLLNALADRVLVRQRADIEKSAVDLAGAQHWPTDGLQDALTSLNHAGLVLFGKARARWMNSAAEYLRLANDPTLLDMIADLMLGMGLVAHETGMSMRIRGDGFVEMLESGTVKWLAMPCSGAGVKRWDVMETVLEMAQSRFERTGSARCIALVTGVNGPRSALETPKNLVAEEPGGESVVDGPVRFEVFEIDELREHPHLAKEFAA